MDEEHRRAMILHLLRRGVSATDIKRNTGATYSTIRRVKQRQTSERKEREGKRTARTPELVQKIAESLERNPRQTMRAIARDSGVSEGTVRTLVRQDLGMQSYARHRRHLISPGAQDRRLDRSKKILNWLKHDGAGLEILHSDEKFFSLAPYSNRRNDKFVWRKGEQDSAPDELRHEGVRQREPGAMFLGIVSSSGKKGPPIWVPAGVKINADVYQDILRHQVRPWIDANFEPGRWVWQQDGATSHTARSTQKMLEEEGWLFLDKSMWPPSSPDCAVLDFAIWDHISGVACRDRAPNVAILKERVNAAWDAMDPSFIRRSCRRFRSRLERVVAARGGRIE